MTAVSGWGQAGPWILLVAAVVVLVGLSVSIGRGFRHQGWWPAVVLGVVVVAGILIVVPARGSSHALPPGSGSSHAPATHP
jgi:4-hydroxybenzoate polyprenyltransferase